ncbi:hypothetical protein LXL04_025916 [Taraxacum kok-saghyz]
MWDTLTLPLRAGGSMSLNRDVLGVRNAGSDTMLIYVEPQYCLSKRALVERGDTPTYIANYRSLPGVGSRSRERLLRGRRRRRSWHWNTTPDFAFSPSHSLASLRRRRRTPLLSSFLLSSFLLSFFLLFFFLLNGVLGCCPHPQIGRWCSCDMAGQYPPLFSVPCLFDQLSLFPLLGCDSNFLIWGKIPISPYWVLKILLPKGKMKRGVDENNKGPMFPRLHVNDTEKGGPRAPPRNKMALYEQLSIPSQRLNGGQPINPNPTSSSQGGMSQRGSFFPHHQTRSPHPVDKINNRYSDLNNQEQKKKQEDDDFRVPILNQQSGINLDCNQNHQNKDNEGLSPLISSFSGRFTNTQRNNPQDLTKYGLNQSLKQSSKDGGSSFDHRNGLSNSMRLQSNVEQEANDVINGDSVSETSMVDSVSDADISPDDVVGVIGQKQFWKARRAMVNQQRLFGVQVFELHRLIKVQKLIAGLPQPMVEDNNNTFPQKVSPIPIKKIPIPLLDHVLKSSTIPPKVKDSHEKSKDDTRELEFTADNAYEKASLSSVQNNSGPGPGPGPGPMFSGYPLPPPDPRMGLWGPGHQWLIPVMSPSEGLIYKPCYPGPSPPASSPMFCQSMVNHGVPQPHYQWPTGFPSMAPPPTHNYFPPYNTTSGNEDTRYKSAHACNNTDVQVSTASSLSENREVLPLPLPLFPTCPLSEGGGGLEPISRVIRVVPRNAQLANESVARIFKSIQDERKRQDPV